MMLLKKNSLLALAMTPFLSWPAHAQENNVKISITINDNQVVTATLEDNQAAKDFASLLPLTLTLKDFHQTEKISGELPKRLTEDGAPFTPVAGDLAYYAPWGNLALFYRDDKHAPGLFKLGAIDSEAEALTVPGSVSVTLETLAQP
jgi:hypothetical protein